MTVTKYLRKNNLNKRKNTLVSEVLVHDWLAPLP
jgi:hypothetical protein